MSEDTGILSRSDLTVDLPAVIYSYTIQRGLPSPRGSVTSPSPHRFIGWSRNFNRVPIALAVRLRLRDRLTPGRLTLPGKPRSYGGRESHPPYRYLYLHLLFAILQYGSPRIFNAMRMLPYRYFYYCYPAPSVSVLYPIIIHAPSLDQ